MSSSIKLLADRDIFKLKQALPDYVDLTLFDPLPGLPENAGQYDALMIRSVTKINASSIGTHPSSLAFIASATAGTDHVDIEFLKSRGITFYNSAGCNARAVAEYVISALLLWSDYVQRDLSDIRVGIIGAGHTGRAVSLLLDRLGIGWKAFDPPRALHDDRFKSCSLDELFASDVLTFHVPLTHQGEFATHHWLNRDILEDHRFGLVINAARGGVVNETDLLYAHNSGTIGHYILDVWENEPLFNDTVAEQALCRTPHIAGYSVQSKWKATVMAAEAMARFFDTGDVKSNHPDDGSEVGSTSRTEGGQAEGIGTRTDGELITQLEEGGVGGKIFQGNDLPEKTTLAQLITNLHPIRIYDRKLAELMGREPLKKAADFEHIRSGFPLRQEFEAISLPDTIFEKHPELEKLGFRRF